MENKRIEIPVVYTDKREKLIKKIEEQVLIIIKQICNSKIPKISYQRCNPELSGSVETNQNYHQSTLRLLVLLLLNSNSNDDQNQEQTVDSTELLSSQQAETIVDFSKKRGRIQFVRMMIILSKVHKLLINNKIQTNRSLYYELKSEQISLFDKETVVNYQINNVAKLLNCFTWDLRLIAAVKGLVAGNLKLIFENTDTIDCNVLGGCLIPQIMSNNMGQLVGIETGAKMIIIVEKEAIFNKLLSENCPDKLKAILITGKGYPDTATRIFVKILVEKLQLPVFVLVDCNPHGFEIMCTYKYGSLNLWWERKELQCYKVKWIGVYPTEMSIYFVEKLPLTVNDIQKLEALEKRTYLSEDEKQELKLMRQGKIEIEAIASNDFISINYLTSVYIPIKIQRFIHID